MRPMSIYYSEVKRDQNNNRITTIPIKKRIKITIKPNKIDKIYPNIIFIIPYQRNRGMNKRNAIYKWTDFFLFVSP